jgi:hypothetical protein
MLNSWWYDLLIGVFFIVILALNEVRIDKKLKAIYRKWLQEWLLEDRDDAYKIYSRSVHDLQIPFRGIALVLFAVVVANHDLWALLVYLLYLAVLYWLVFDVLVNKLWLNMPWWYIGGTAKSDDLFNDNKGELILFWAIKILGILGFGMIYFILNT